MHLSEEPGPTNNHKPFEPEELIVFAGNIYIVRQNFGSSGVVEEFPEGAKIKFVWNFQGEHCKRYKA